MIVTAPAAFRFTYDADPERHHHVAALLNGEPIEDLGPDTLPEVLRALMRDVGAPSGVRELGYDDVVLVTRGHAPSELAALRALVPRPAR